jgi:DNA invertase Pin-like site-specific DNA recombinase
MTRQKNRQPGDPNIAVAYLRASKTEQQLSPEAQRAAIENWAARRGVQVVSWHLDHGLSGGSSLDDRPALGAALGALRTHKAGILVIARRDRLARDSAIAIAIDRAVTAAGARIISADGVGNGTSPADAFLRTVVDAASEYERALIRSRTKAALAAKRARNERAGGVPYGYRLAADRKTLLPHKAERTVIETVRGLRRDGLSLRAIVAECARRGVVSRSGRALGKTQVERMIRSSAT